MSRGLRDRFDPEHLRARELAAAKVGEPLDPDDAAWLDTHLAWCAPCRAVAGEYETQRLELRALRLNDSQPPRDLWARTAAALEVERTRRGVRTERAAPRTTPAIRSRTSFPVGAMTGALAAVFVVGVTLLSGQQARDPSPDPEAMQPTPAIVGTPFPVSPRNVLVFVTDERMLAVSSVNVDRVCPVDVGPNCTSTVLGSKHGVGVSARRNVIDAISNGTKSHVVIFHDEPGGELEVVVVPVIAETARPGTLESPPPPSEEPVESTAPSEAASASPRPTASADPTTSSVATPTEVPTPATTTQPPASETPTASAAPSETPSEVPSDAPSDTPSDAPPSLQVTAQPDDGRIVIAADVIVVGRSAAYSPGGDAFAFTARPADGSHGPDVYLWNVGTEQALPITTDHESIFSGWVGEHLLISRSSPDGDPLEGARGELPVSLVLDPGTGVETVIADAPMFRPTVDPTGRWAVWWDGAIEPGPDGFGWQPRSGRLLLGHWTAPGSAVGDDTGRDEEVLASGPVPDWEARWDDTGTRLAIWIAGRDDPTTGKLSLFGIDRSTGRLDTTRPLLQDESALPGFSIDHGQLVWAVATQGGDQRVEVLAWNGSDVGKVELDPEQQLIIVR